MLVQNLREVGIMAVCSFCGKGIGPTNKYEFIFHKLGVFGTHDYCKSKMVARLDKEIPPSNNASEGKTN